MSAWARLAHWDGSGEFLALCNEALLEVQREHAHKLAEKIRAHCPCAPGCCSCGTAADLIDPEVST